jgi:deoxyribonuclease V
MGEMIEIPHEWLYPQDWNEAAQVQRQMANQVVREDQWNTIHTLAGTDVSNTPRDPENRIYAAMVGLSYPGLKILHSACESSTATLPYQPGFLGFREAPALENAFKQLCEKMGALPDCLMVDGHGISHPRGLGIASHLGVLLDCPSIGVAKSILVGRPDGELGNQVGDFVPLRWKGQTLGLVLRTRPNVQPVYVSVGHRVSLETAMEIVLKCLSRYRLPEPTRQAHQAANLCRRGAEAITQPIQLELLSVNP